MPIGHALPAILQIKRNLVLIYSNLRLPKKEKRQ